jgi:hypothetical protein
MGRLGYGNHPLMQTPTVHIETLQDPRSYTPEQIEHACRLATLLGRGRLVLVEPPQALH